MFNFFDKIIKQKVIDKINNFGIGICELIMDIELSWGTCNSIEYIKKTNSIYLHTFDDNLDIITDFNSLDKVDKIKILIELDNI